MPRGGTIEAEDQFGNIGGGQGATKQIALDLLHAGMGQHGFKLRLGLDPLGDDRQFEVPTDPGDAGQKPQGAWIGVDIGNEGAIDLEFGKRQGVEIAQRRITGAEIVERNRYPAIGQMRQHLLGQVPFLDEGGLGNFEFQPVRLQPRRGQRLFHNARQVEAAEIDGANHLQTFLDVILPMARPGIVALSIFTFLGNFQSFFWPLVMVKDDAMRTIPIGLLSFQGQYGQQTELIMAATVMNVVPLIILFIVMQKQLISGIQLGGVKG